MPATTPELMTFMVLLECVSDPPGSEGTLENAWCICPREPGDHNPTHRYAMHQRPPRVNATTNAQVSGGFMGRRRPRHPDGWRGLGVRRELLHLRAHHPAEPEEPGHHDPQ